MTEFDAELHLWLVGERMLLDPSDRHGPPWASPLAAAAQALVAVDAIAEQAATEVLDDYAVADALRSPIHSPSRMRLRTGAPPPRAASAPLSPRRFVVCDRRIQTAGGVVHARYVSLADDATRIGASFRPGPAGRLGSGRRLGRPPMRPIGHPPQLTLTDDRGTTTSAHFVGGGAEEWHGQFWAIGPLARDTAWIEIGGDRIELVDVASPAVVSTERLPEQDPAIRHLWRLVTTEPRHVPGSSTAEAAIAALVACGALASDDPAIGETQAAREAIGHGPMGAGPGAPRLPDPWHSLLSRAGRADGPDGISVVNAVTPVFDGITVAVTTLESRADEWTLTVDVLPDVAMHHFHQSARQRALTWWAVDDVGNHYLGATGSWSGGGDLGSGEIGFWPPLDPSAGELVLMPTAEAERATIRLPLSWAPAGTSPSQMTPADAGVPADAEVPAETGIPADAGAP